MRNPLHTTPVTSGPPWWHVAWATFLGDSPVSGRDGDALALLYSELAASGDDIAFSVVPPVSAARSIRDGRAVVLSPPARDAVTAAIRDLADHDRIAGDTPVAAVATTSHSVHVLLSCSSETLHQRVGRLKSRSATLLAFEAQLGVGGRNTWSRGFWWARFRAESTVQAVARYFASLV